MCRECWCDTNILSCLFELWTAPIFANGSFCSLYGPTPCLFPLSPPSSHSAVTFMSPCAFAFPHFCLWYRSACFDPFTDQYSRLFTAIRHFAFAIRTELEEWDRWENSCAFLRNFPLRSMRMWYNASGGPPGNVVVRCALLWTYPVNWYEEPTYATGALLEIFPFLLRKNWTSFFAISVELE